MSLPTSWVQQAVMLQGPVGGGGGGGANSPVGMVLAIGEGGRCLDCYVTYFTV